MIQTNVIHAAYLSGVKRLIFLGSSCIYPKNSPQPIKEDYLLSSPLEETNRAYAIAKIAGLEMCRDYNFQFGTKFISAMPTNIYGINDTYDINNSHVIPALILKVHQAKISNSKEVVVWGSGNPKREFLFSDDLAEALVLLMTISDDNYKTIENGIINIGYGSDIKIIELINILKEIIEYRGEVVFDISKPDGVSQKLLDSTNILRMGWAPKTDIIAGLKKTYESFLIEHKNKIHQ